MNAEEKWRFLRDAPQADARHPEIKRTADLLWQAAEGDLRRFVLLAQTVARDWVRYQTDTDRVGREDIAGLTRSPTPDDAVDALRRGVDDCDAKARLFCALCIARAVPAQMVPKWTKDAPRDLTHVFAQVHIRGRWCWVETILARARLGELGDNVPFEKGTESWLYS